MDIPKPVDINALSVALLAKSKKIMNLVESKNPVKQKDTYSDSSQNSYGSEMYNEADEKEPMYENFEYTNNSQPLPNPTEVRDYTDEQVMNSNLPQNIKEAMLKNRIPKLSALPSKFTAEDISRITGAPIRQPKQVVNEVQNRVQNSDMITISRSELQNMINESINTFFKQTYDKTITEEAIKKTINLLIKEGKITTKKKQI
jgi:hypothetical protein